LFSIVSVLVAGWFAPNAYALPFMVVLDPGHGGSDTGAKVPVGRSWMYEKDVTLAVAKNVARVLMSQGVPVALTRTQDQDLQLSSRTAVANRLKANVFLSLHMNSSIETTQAEGVETYILNNATDHSSKRLADLENAVLQGSRATTAIAHNTSGDVALIVKDLMLDSNLLESQRLACAVQNDLVQATSTTSTRYRNRGVKQALFFVLLGADMPSALVEMGFLNNNRDRDMVSSQSGLSRMGSSIAHAIIRFKNRSALGRCKVGEHPVFNRQTVQITAQLKKPQ
jgi:N-acetylmuramoyl-L-alanine amidase